MNEHDRIKELISAKRAKRIQALIAYSIAVVLMVILLAFSGEELPVFLIAGATLLFSLYKLICAATDNTVRLIGKEVRGKIVEKKEGMHLRDERKVGGYGSFSNPRPYEHGRRFMKTSTVFIETEDQEIASVEKLNEDQTRFYEIGDEVIIFKGARYPYVINKSGSEQTWLCPICGSVLPTGVECRRCGLDP